jgi:hypothetical protein
VFFHTVEACLALLGTLDKLLQILEQLRKATSSAKLLEERANLGEVNR